MQNTDIMKRKVRQAVNQRYLHKETAKLVEEEVLTGIKLLSSIKEPIITFFGSHSIKKSSADYKNAYNTSFALAEEGYAIMSGGGPGIMHAANAGAKKAGSPSIGVMADMLVEERISDNIFTHQAAYNFMFVRRFILSIKSEALVFYPGGYGTLNELFEFLVLIQTGMIERVPVVLVDSKFWKGMNKWIDELAKSKMIKKSDLKLIQHADTTEEILQIVKKFKRK
jgi:uncharacterized protein (TIGR00730 family)